MTGARWPSWMEPPIRAALEPKIATSLRLDEDLKARCEARAAELGVPVALLYRAYIRAGDARHAAETDHAATTDQETK